MTDGISGWGKAPMPGDITKLWPVGADGEPDPPALLARISSVNAEDAMLVQMLRGYGIPAIMTQPGDYAIFSKVVLGLSGTGSEIYVPETMYQDAKMLMEAEPDDELLD